MKKGNKLVRFLPAGLLLIGVCMIGLYKNGINAVSEKKEASSAVPAPELSAESGFYDDPFQLYITMPENTEVYYTFDGSRPTADSLKYTGPILIGEEGWEPGAVSIQNMRKNWLEEDEEIHGRSAVVLRACAVSENGAFSDTVTATYLIRPEDHYKDTLIVSLVAEPEDLFGDNGIYVTGKAYDDWYLGDRSQNAPAPNYLQHGKAWERPAVLELLWGNSFLQQPVGIRIQGSSMREQGSKRFSVYARKEYSGSGYFDTPVFGSHRSHSFMLRSGFMNAYIQHLVQDRAVASAESHQAVVLINGFNWYTTFAQEKYSGKYFEEQYGVDDDNVIIAKAGWTESAEDQGAYQAIYDFLAAHDLFDEASYRQFEKIIDVQSYIDFTCVNVYFANMDYSEEKNTVCWRTRKTGFGEYEDGRWRWALYDMDLENLTYGTVPEEINAFTTGTHYAGGALNTRPLYTALKTSPDFRKQFVLSFMDMINTDFTVERASEAMENWNAVGRSWGIAPEWVSTYFPARTKAIIGHLTEEFNLTGDLETVSLNTNAPEGGKIILNTIEPDLSDGEWSGDYFTDYPVTVTAVANDGYRFKEWQSKNLSAAEKKQDSLTVDLPAGGLALYAVFEKI